MTKRKQNTTCSLNKLQWQSLAALLQAGYSLSDSFALLEISFEGLKEGLQRGEELRELLISGQRGSFYRHLAFFLQTSELSNAIQSALAMENFEKGIGKRLASLCAYPLFILLFAYGMLIFFSAMILPQMLQGFELELEADALLAAVRLLQVFCIMTAVLLGSFVLLLLLLLVSRRIRCFALLKAQRCSSLLQDHTSYLLAGYLMQLSKQGISTRKALDHLSRAEGSILFQTLIQDCQKQLEEGEDFLDIVKHSKFLNRRFQKMIPLGIMTSSLTEILDIFMKQQLQLWEKKAKQAALVLQLVSYGFVALLVLVVYQLMLLPLSMLEQF